MAITSKFTFVGEPVIPKESSKSPFVKRLVGGKNGTTNMLSLNFGVKANNSVGYVEMFGMETPTIYSMNTDNEKIEIDWDDRKSAETISNVASYKKHFINLVSENRNDTETFITPYDAIEYVEEHLKSVKKVLVTGVVEKEPYVSKQGNQMFVDKYVAQNIYIVDENSKPKLRINMDLFYTKDSIDKSDFKSEKIITVDGYIRQYLRNSKSVVAAVGDMGKEVFMPQKVVVNATKFDLSNSKHKGILQSIVDELECSNSKKLYHCAWECSLIYGAEEVEWDESQLTPKQRRMVELGERTADSFKPKGSILGSRISEIRLIRPDFYGEFENGVVEADFSLNELEDELVKFTEVESLDDIVNAATKKAKDDIPFEMDDLDADTDIDDLFD